MDLEGGQYCSCGGAEVVVIMHGHIDYVIVFAHGDRVSDAESSSNLGIIFRKTGPSRVPPANCQPMPGMPCQIQLMFRLYIAP